jgi:hypothetical protein
VQGRIDKAKCGIVSMIPVVVGDTVTRSDAHGSFSARVHGRGTLRIWVPGSVDDDAFVKLDGSGSYTASPLTADFCDYD